jgi:hypothetical protein
MVQLTVSKYQISETEGWTRVAPCGGNHPAACGRHPSQEGNRTRVWTWENAAHGAGNHPAACGRHPSQEGNRTRVWTWENAAHGAGNHPPACGRYPSTEGIGFGRGLRDCEMTYLRVTPVLTPVPIPSVEGCRPQAAGWFPRHADASIPLLGGVPRSGGVVSPPRGRIHSPLGRGAA